MGITRVGLDLLADLLTGTDRGAIAWMAFGSGDAAWDTTAPDPDPARSTLVHEVFRRPLSGGTSQLGFDDATRTVTARLTLRAGEATGELREVALFAGRASARPGSGSMVHHLVHPVATKAEGDELRRIVELKLPAELDDTLAAAIGGALVGRRHRGHLVGIAVGSSGAAAPAGRLVAEELRREFVAGELLYDTDNAALTVVARFDAADLTPSWPTDDRGDPTPVREVGLVVGADLAEGTVVARSSIDAHDLRQARPLVYRARIGLGSTLAVDVPDLLGSTVADAAAELAPRLLVGAVREVSRPGTTAATVVEQDPPAGSTLPELARVDVVIVKRRTVLVPDVTGLDEPRARTALRARDLDVSEVTDNVLGKGESGPTSGSIVAIDPPAGTTVERGSLLRLWRAVYARAPLTDVRGRLLDSALRQLARDGFLATPTTVGRPSIGTVGSVILQRPAPGTSQGYDEPIELTLAVPVTVAVPDVTGRPIDEAVEAIRAAGLRAAEEAGRPGGLPGLSVGSVIAVDQPAQQTEPGTVLRQSPVAGELAALHGSINLWVAAGASVPVPDLSRQDERAATRALASIGLRVGSVSTKVVPEAVGQVVAQVPPAGAVVPAASAVGLTVASAARVPTPDLSGYGPDGVAEVLAARGLVLGDEQPGDLAGRPGTVAAQKPNPGSVVDVGSAVDVVFVRGVPMVVGLHLDVATNVIAAAGLQVESQEVAHDAAVGTIVSQDPQAGDPLPANNRILLGVSALATVAVPELIGRDPTTSANLTRRLGLELVLAGQDPDATGVAVGLVARQEPAPGVVVNRASAVQVWVRAAAAVPIPDVRGLTVDEALTQLGDARLIGRLGEPTPSIEFAAGLVATLEPPAGTPVPAGTIVAVRPASAATVLVPDLRAFPADRAADALKAAGLGVGFQDTYAAFQLPRGIDDTRWVVSQLPRPGSEVPAGTVVSLVLGIRLPSVIGRPREQAVAALESCGVRCITRQIRNKATEGTVVSTAPPPESLVVLGTLVTLVVSSGLFFNPIPDDRIDFDRVVITDDDRFVDPLVRRPLNPGRDISPFTRDI